ncbi:alginate biosynthesis protein Alg44 [Metapseudomonas resinovorans]|uniref:Alginate biosynthesis protein Alg44 n=1 Tax=Metapseudomonas resinovorans NBRC 106553 TaxID=1245471 RepID=S6ATW8_METRE|nr:alginate biosynthesis protein Alg44 [Pseudomonas resinovorans]BAN49553.1 alginate biosynthesis protein Alg44 [Pseudomonas resinovorans NBRC 106553]
MSTATGVASNSNIVHESEAQRQYARLKMPAKVRFLGPNRETLESELLDLSAGGFSFANSAHALKEGSHHKGKLVFQVDGLGMAIDVEFQVRSVQGEGKRVGCEFHNLRPREVAALRYLITAYTSGEMVTMGDMLNTLQRDNFAKARKGKGAGGGMGFFGRLRALTFSLAIFLVGVGAFTYILNQLYQLYFVTHADSAMVNLPSQVVSMPREGVVQAALVKVGGEVAKGAPLATFSATMLDVLKNNLPEGQMTPDNIERLFSKSLQGTLTSPCDCRVVAQLVGDGQPAAKGAPVFELLPLEGQATIEARFPYKTFAKVQPGAEVNVQVAGESVPRVGHISSVTLQQGGLASDLRVSILTSEPLATEMAGRPAEVTIDGLPGNLLLDKVMAAGK